MQHAMMDRNMLQRDRRRLEQGSAEQMAGNGRRSRINEQLVLTRCQGKGCGHRGKLPVFNAVQVLCSISCQALLRCSLHILCEAGNPCKTLNRANLCVPAHPRTLPLLTGRGLLSMLCPSSPSTTAATAEKWAGNDSNHSLGVHCCPCYVPAAQAPHQPLQKEAAAECPGYPAASWPL